MVELKTGITLKFPSNNLSNFHFYNDLSQLGLSEGASINNLLAKMPVPSVGVFYCLSKSITGLPFDTQCMVTIFKNGSPFRIEVQDIWSGRTYVATYSNKTVGEFVEYALKSDLVPIQKGSTFLEDIGSLSSPSQLKHAGFYKLPTMTADVNTNAGTETMTEYTTGDFYGLLLGSNINTTDGCEYGTLIVSSPRIRSAIWVGSIWQKKFISWYKIGKS